MIFHGTIRGLVKGSILLLRFYLKIFTGQAVLERV